MIVRVWKKNITILEFEYRNSYSAICAKYSCLKAIKGEYGNDLKQMLCTYSEINPLS